MAATRRRSAQPAPDARAPRPREPGFLDLAPRQFVDTTRLSRGAPAAPAMSRRQFEAEYQRLLREYGQGEENPGSFSCQGCRQCASCMFCVDCEGCYRCTHCTRCRDSSHCTHCEDCESCHGSAYCVRSSGCSGSSYLVLCRACSDCTYCFGCVGLQKKDFHVLNAPYTKTEYFRIVKALRAEMGI